MHHQQLTSFAPALVLISLSALAACDPLPSSPAGPDGLTEPTSTMSHGQQEGVPMRLQATGALAGRQLAPGFGPPTFGKSDFGGRCSVPSDLLIRFTLDGHGSHLGRITATLEHCSVIDFATGRSVYGDGIQTVVAANGAKLWTTYVGRTLPDGTFEDEHRIAGGTGRFTEATGSFTLLGLCERATASCPDVSGVGRLVYHPRLAARDGT